MVKYYLCYMKDDRHGGNNLKKSTLIEVSSIVVARAKAIKYLKDNMKSNRDYVEIQKVVRNGVKDVCEVYFKKGNYVAYYYDRNGEIVSKYLNVKGSLGKSFSY